MLRLGGRFSRGRMRGNRREGRKRILVVVVVVG